MENNQCYQNISVTNSTNDEKEIVNNILIKLSLYIRRYQTRKQLEKLSPEQLRDVGLSAEQVIEESQKPFWR